MKGFPYNPSNSHIETNFFRNSHRKRRDVPKVKEMSQVLFAYFGPETVLPLSSMLTALAGVVLMFGRQIRLVVRIVLQRTAKLLRRGPKDMNAPLPRAGLGSRLDQGTTLDSHHIHVRAHSDNVPNQVEV